MRRRGSRTSRSRSLGPLHQHRRSAASSDLSNRRRVASLTHNLYDNAGSRRRTMARKRSTPKTDAQSRKRTSAPQTTTTPSPAASPAASFTCPECGRTFTRAAALGAHRSRAHGVAGRSARRAGSTAGNSPATRTSGGGTGNARTRGKTSAATRSTASGRRTSRRAAASSSGVDRNQLLSALFPTGIPPREGVIREVDAWLDQAERLANLK
jgi:hypothetical protein